MKLAVVKDISGSNPMGGFHYLLMPVMLTDQSAPLWEGMGHTIIEVEEEHGKRLLQAAGAALQHQMEIAVLTERAIQDAAKSGLST